MNNDTSHHRRVIVRKLYAYLRKNYPKSYLESAPTASLTTPWWLDALLAFKSDACLVELRRALERLDQGTFGICMSCKEEIDMKALDADPARLFCTRCEGIYSRREPIHAEAHVSR